MIYLLLLPCLSLAAADAPIEVATNIACVLNKTLPPFQPNIYLCPSSSLCCVTRQKPACCEKDVSVKQILRQSLPFVALLVIFLLTAGIISWYYSDNDIVEDEDEDAFRKKTNLNKILLPSLDEEIVDDPIFGRVWDEKAPRYARPHQEQSVGYLADDTKKTN